MLSSMTLLFLNIVKTNSKAEEEEPVKDALIFVPLKSEKI